MRGPVCNFLPTALLPIPANLATYTTYRPVTYAYYARNLYTYTPPPPTACRNFDLKNGIMAMLTHDLVQVVRNVDKVRYMCVLVCLVWGFPCVRKGQGRGLGASADFSLLRSPKAGVFASIGG